MTQHQYTIAPSDMAFHALTTSLYKDRLRAPVREILSNSIDSQRRLGNVRAIEVKLPTPIDAQFRIRDYGSGLSRADMQRLYSSLFSSDKHLTRPNEVGGFGVGAKSPFAYTDAFTVESYHNGKYTVYSAFMDGNRAPQLLELFEQETTEPNGLAVSYPIAKDDVSALVQAVRQEVGICGHPVDCIGFNEPVVVLENHPAFEQIGGAWLGSDTDFVSGTQLDSIQNSKVKRYARMGNVVYPLAQLTSLPKELNDLMALFNQTVSAKRKSSTKDWRVAIFEAPIGSLRPAMSREELVANDPLTVAGLARMHLAALRGIYQHALEENDPEECKRLFKDYQAFALPNEWSQELAPEIIQLEAIAERIKHEEALWKPRALVVDPMLMEMLNDRSSDDVGYFGFRPNCLVEALMPVEESRYGDRLSLWSNETTIAMVPHEDAVQLDGFLRPGWNIPDDDWDSPPIHMALLNTLAQIDTNAPEATYFGITVLLLAKSKKNEEKLLQMAQQYGKNVHVLNLSTHSVQVAVPAPFSAAQSIEASPTDPANPHTKASSNMSEPFTAQYWDMEQAALVETTLTATPPYCVAGAKMSQYNEDLLRNWQPKMGADCTLYTVPKDKLSISDRRNGISRMWQQTAQALVQAQHKPSSPLEWLIASIDLPKQHPLYRPEQVQHVNNYQLLMQLKKHSMGNHGDHFFSPRYTDFGWAQDLDYGPNPAYDKPLLAIYPLLEGLDALSRQLNTLLQPKHFDAIRQYIALVDRTHGHEYTASAIEQSNEPSL